MAIFSATHNIDHRNQFHLVQQSPFSEGSILEEGLCVSVVAKCKTRGFSNPEESPVYKQCPRDVTIGMTAVRILCIPKENTWKGGR